MDREILEAYISRIQGKGLMNPFTLDSGRKINKIQIIIKKKVLINKVYLQIKRIFILENSNRINKMEQLKYLILKLYPKNSSQHLR